MIDIKPVAYAERQLLSMVLVPIPENPCRFTQFPLYSGVQVEELKIQLEKLKAENVRDIMMLNAWAERAKNAEKLIAQMQANLDECEKRRG